MKPKLRKYNFDGKIKVSCDNCTFARTRVEHYDHADNHRLSAISQCTFANDTCICGTCVVEHKNIFRSLRFRYDLNTNDLVVKYVGLSVSRVKSTQQCIDIYYDVQDYCDNDIVIYSILTSIEKLNTQIYKL